MPTSSLRLPFAALLLAAVLVSGGSCRKPIRLFLDAPIHGTITQASQVTVAGRLLNAGSGAQVLVNGSPVPVAGDGTWSTSVPLDPVAIVNPLTAAFVKANGQVIRKRVTVLTGDAIADGGFSPMGVALRLNDRGLDEVEPVIGSLVDLDLATLLPQGSVLIDNECFVDGGFLGCLGRATVTVTSPAPSISSFAIAVDSRVASADADVDIFGMDVNVFIDGSGLVPNCGLNLQADSTAILGNYALSADPVDPTLVDVNQNGSVGVSFAGFQQTFTSGACDDFLIGDIIQLFIGDLEDTVVDGLVDFLSDPDGAGSLDSPIADAVETALADVQIAGPIGESIGVNLEAPLFDVFEDEAGLTLDSDARITASTPDPDAPDLLASWHVDDLFPDYAVCEGGSANGLACASGADCPSGLCASRTPAGLDYGLGISISTSAFNQLLKAEIESGLLRTVLTELNLGGGPIPITAGFLAALVPEFAAFEDPTQPLEIRLSPTLAPFLPGAPGPAGELAEMRIPHLLAEVVEPGSGSVVLSFAIDATVGLDVSFSGGELAFDVGALLATELGVTILQNGLLSDEVFLENLLLAILPPLFPSLAGALESFPLPAFLGLDLAFVEVGRQGQYLTLYFDLTQAP